MENEWIDIAEFTAYIVAVVVGLDMIAERWFHCCKSKNKDVSHPTSPPDFRVEEGTAGYTDDSFGSSLNDFGEN